jgi:ATP-binding cassette, subfamily C (CFTR/MRP), member 1
VTIRAFGWQDEYFRKTLERIDSSQRPYYLLLCIQRWLICVLNLIVAGLTVLIVGIAVALRSKVNPGLLGLALVVMMTLGYTLTAFVEWWTHLETSLGAVSRIKSFQEDTPSELLLTENADPGEDWPKQGTVRFDNVSLSYKFVIPQDLTSLALVLTRRKG